LVGPGVDRRVVGDGAAVGVALLVVVPGAGEGGVAAAPRPVEDWQAASAVATATLAKANIHLRLRSLNPFIAGLLSSVGSTDGCRQSGVQSVRWLI